MKLTDSFFKLYIRLAATSAEGHDPYKKPSELVSHQVRRLVQIVKIRLILFNIF